MDEKLRQVVAVVTDVDGVMTDGSIIVGAQGDTQVFHVRDGLGIKLLQAAGIPVAILTGRASAPVLERARSLGIEIVKLGRIDKQVALLEITESLGITPDQCAYIGDDLPDLAPFAMVAVAFCPADAVAEVQKAADHVVPIQGGKGVVRYVAEKVLKAQGHWQKLVESHEVRS